MVGYHRFMVRFVASLVIAALLVVPARGEDLFIFVRDGTYADVEQALASRQWSPDELGKALIAAAGLNKLKEATLLLAKGADVNYRMVDRNGVIVAVTEDNAEVLDVLLKNGGDPNWRGAFDWRPLHYAMARGRSFDKGLLLLLQYGADVNATTNLQITPLHRAAGFCLRNAVEILLQHGADKLLREKYGKTAAQRAAKAGCNDIAAMLQ